MGERRLILCFDGTWNTLDSETNVSRIFTAVGDASSDCTDQLKFYDEGVGTTWGEKIRGGVFGWGLDQNILEGYCWLINHYRAGPAAPDDNDPNKEPFSRGDDIFLFGFSRGAFTARSLGGLINRLGIIDASQIPGKPAETTDELVQKAWKLYRETYRGAGEARDAPKWAGFRAKHAIATKIKCVGVWDTVGALGIPVTRAPIPLARGRYQFHDQSLGRVVEHAYHAVAIDEHREDYNVTLWTRKHPIGTLDVEQRWFPGAHANVGGGYQDDLLPDAPLLWMVEKAAALGLEFAADGMTMMETGSACRAEPPTRFGLDGREFMSPVRDSYAEFLRGAYKAVKTFAGGPFYRRMMVDTDGVGQCIDVTARLKWKQDPDYRPFNLAQSGRIDVNTNAPAALVVPARTGGTP